MSVPVAANENVVCTFTNTEVKKRTEGEIKTFLDHRAHLLARPGRSFITRLESDPSAGPERGLKDDAPEPMKLGQDVAQSPLSASAANSASPHPRLASGPGIAGFGNNGRSRFGRGGSASQPGDVLDVSDANASAAPLPLSGSVDNRSQRLNFATSLNDLQRNTSNSEKTRMSNLGVNPDDYGVEVGGTAQSRANVWAEAEINRFDAGSKAASSSGDFNLFSGGADYVVTPGVLLVGVMAQSDHMRERSNSIGYDITGTGWMAGPYAALRLSQHVFIEGRGLWGTSDNDI